MNQNATTIANGILRAIAIILGCCLLVYFLYEIRSVIAYLAIAAVIALLGRPIVLFLRRKLKFPNTTMAFQNGRTVLYSLQGCPKIIGQGIPRSTIRGFCRLVQEEKSAPKPKQHTAGQELLSTMILDVGRCISYFYSHLLFKLTTALFQQTLTRCQLNIPY